MLGRAAIDDNVWRAALRCDQWKGSGRVNGQGRAERYYQIRFQCSLGGAFAFRRIEALPEADGRRFQKSPTLTPWRPARAAEVIEVRVGISAPLTALTFDQCVRAMKLDETFCACPGETVQPVDVLCDHTKKLSRSLESYDGVVHRIRLRGPKCIPAFQLVIPVLDSRCIRSHKILEIDGPASRPDTLWPAEIWDAAGGGDARSGEDQHLIGWAKVVGKSHNLLRKYAVHYT